MINQPKIILADEPTGSLDADSADQLGGLLADLNRDHAVALMIVTHSMKLAAQMQSGYALQHGGLEPSAGPIIKNVIKAIKAPIM